MYAAEAETLDQRFDHLSKNGNSTCSATFTEYGGVGKLLIREHTFTGEQLVEVWNLSIGCGGGAEHHG